MKACISKTITNRLKELNMAPLELAKKFNISKNEVVSWQEGILDLEIETIHMTIDITIIYKLTTFLDLSLHEVLGCNIEEVPWFIKRDYERTMGNFKYFRKMKGMTLREISEKTEIKLGVLEKIELYPTPLGKNKDIDILSNLFDVNTSFIRNINSNPLNMY